MYGQLYRHLLLPFFDGVVKGRQTMRHWRDAEVRQWWSRPQLEALQLEALRGLLDHAVTTCPWYRDEWQRRALNARAVHTLAEFQAWPLITRETIREHRLHMRTTLPLKRMSKGTGGSSGEPLQFDLDSGSNDRRTAMMYRGYGWAGGAPGSRQLFIWGSHVGRVPLWKRWKAALHHRLECHRMLSCFEFTPDKMPEHIAAINAYRPEVVVAYTNPAYELARFAEAHQLPVFSPKSIIVGAEKLHPFQREVLERVFQAPVFETYGSREFMLIGAECEHHTGLHLTMDNLLVEILDDDGRPTPEGQEGNVVITDLYNYGMPFIRYVNGDRAIAGYPLCPCGRGLPLLQKVVGRRLDTLETPDGRKIPGEFFPHLIKEFPCVRRFQIVQQCREEIAVKLVIDGDFPSATQQYLLSEIRKCTGDVVQLSLQVVDDIPLTKAGKLKVVVNAI